MGASLPRPAALNARLDLPIEEWPYLDEMLLKTRSRKVCMTCHWFRHHAGVNCIPGLTSRCQGWSDDLVRRTDGPSC
ncbi:galactose oxidase [Cyanobium sp. BA20m-p-22]|uniref:galactose oxidase n=1 Tax=Cyanobium sp. BA20m-p-22 TaxID=2823704 RepID=UPI0020CBF466|nr:galactose oxidase [Cyanobium sp. BA20m-p-22]MCP9911418.1 galactose oxidase [Cyanobium sp. BA20m-p-22]